MNLEKTWKEYCAQCVPMDAGQAQVEGTRWAFYAGMGVMMKYFTTRIPDMEEADAMAAINSMIEQMQQYADEMRK